MSQTRSPLTIPRIQMAGRALTVLVGAVLVLAGVLKIVNVGADDMLEGLEKAHLLQHKTLISVLAIVCGALLLASWTWKMGLLMATAYWGGAIVAHLTYNDSVVMPAAFLALLWLGAGLAIILDPQSPAPPARRDPPTGK